MALATHMCTHPENSFCVMFRGVAVGSWPLVAWWLACRVTPWLSGGQAPCPSPTLGQGAGARLDRTLHSQPALDSNLGSRVSQPPALGKLAPCPVPLPLCVPSGKQGW